MFALEMTVEIYFPTMEPTGGYEQSLIIGLQNAGYDVILANGFRVNSYTKAMGYNAKNDKIDSLVIRDFAKEMFPKGQLEILMVKSVGFRKLEQWLNRRAQVIKILVSEKLRLEKRTVKVIRTQIKKSVFYH